MKKLSTYEVNERMRTEYFANPFDEPDGYAEKRFVDLLAKDEDGKSVEDKLKEILLFLGCSGFQTIKGYRECEYYWNNAESKYCSTCKASIKLKELLK